mgnify:CR=1 FL=1
MTDRKWKTWEVIGLLVTLALGRIERKMDYFKA